MEILFEKKISAKLRHGWAEPSNMRKISSVLESAVTTAGNEEEAWNDETGADMLTEEEEEAQLG